MSILETRSYKKRIYNLEKFYNCKLSSDNPKTLVVYDLVINEIQNMGHTLLFFEQFCKCFKQYKLTDREILIAQDFDINESNINKYIELVEWIGSAEILQHFSKYIIQEFIFKQCRFLDLVYDNFFIRNRIIEMIQKYVTIFDYMKCSNHKLTIIMGKQCRAFERVNVNGFHISYIEQYISPEILPMCKQLNRTIFFKECDL